MAQNENGASEGRETPWHARDVDEVIQALETTRDGLGEEEARKRLEEYGPNRLEREEKESALHRLLRQFNNVLIYILIIAAVLAAVVGQWMDTGVILAVVVIIAVIGFIQEGKAAQALESIREMLSLEAKVRRGGREQTIPAEEVVPGDVVLLKSGDKVPADIRLVEARDVQIQESVLTGESEPVPKSTDPVEPDAPTGDRQGMAYSSTVVTSGTLEGVVVATGENTEIGRIGQMVSEVEELKTPLIRKMDRFARWLAGAIIILSAAVFVFGLFVQDYPVGEMLMYVVGLAVAAIPSGLPAIMTITLALGVQTMAKRNAIIRRLPAVETLGSVTVIFSDKTGTLTRNEMTVKRIVTAKQRYSVEGTGYEPEGEIVRDEEPVSLEDAPDLQELVRAGFLCNDSTLQKDEETGEWRLQGQPTEGAVFVLGRKAGLERASQEEGYPRLDTIPFKSENRFMATLHRTPEDGKVIYLKGAPEKVLGLCDRQRSGENVEDLQEEFWHEKMEAIADEGHRVLAIAVKDADPGKDSLEKSDTEGGFTLLGLVGMIDPPREEAISAIEKCRGAGIRVKMVTGDHALTARSIGAQMGIGDGEHAVTGRRIEETDDAELQGLAWENDVFARSSPEHKIRLIQALQARGQIVAMTGDGVNDSPALKRADIGVAMGIKGSEAAKDASEMVLADDNFASIEKAVEEGRTVYDNLKKTILFLLPTNGAESLVIIFAILLGGIAPVTPVQILWVNMVTAVTLGLALAFEPAETDLMQRPPRPQDEPILSKYLIWRIVFVALIIAALTFWLFFRKMDAGLPLERVRTVAINVLVAGQFFYLFNSRFFRRPSISVKGLTGNRVALLAAGALIVLQLILTYFPPFQRWFGTAGLSGGDWLQILGAGVAVFLLVETEKALMRRVENRHASKEEA